MQLSTREAKQLLEKLGIELKECKHHVRGFVTYRGRKLFAVHVSFGKKELPGRVPHLFRRSLRLTVEEFRILQTCQLDQEAYVNLLKAKNEIEK